MIFELTLFGVFLFEDVELRIDAFTTPTFVNGTKVFVRFGLLSSVACFFDPFSEEFTVAFEFVDKLGIVGKVIDLMGILFEIVKFFGRAFSEEGPGGDFSKFTLGMEFAKAFGWGLFVAILGLEKNAIGHEVAEVAELVSTHGPDAVDRVIATVTGRNDMVPRFVVVGKEILSVEVVGKFDAGQSEGGGRDIKTADKFVAGCMFLDARS